MRFALHMITSIYIVCHGVTPFSLVTNCVMSHMGHLVTFTFSLMILALIPGRGKRLFSFPNLSTVPFAQSFLLAFHFDLPFETDSHDHWQSAPFSDSKLLSKLEHITKVMCLYSFTLKALLINPLNAELNPICHLLALLGAHHILHISRQGKG